MVVPPATGANGSTHFAPTRPPTRLHSSNIPYSARRAPPLDMSTVERRGAPFASREPAKRVRPHGLQEAPTFRPTEDEFKDPMEYMRKIAPEGRKYGICRIIPPDGWDPKFAIDTEVRYGSGILRVEKASKLVSVISSAIFAVPALETRVRGYTDLT
jgi:[histone H3]-trimethyl-L-lysine4 demethylase